MKGKVKYVKEDGMEWVERNGMPYVIIRTYSAGVHAGFLAKRDGMIVELRDATRIWSWRGAFTLSEIAMNGVSKPEECKFAVQVQKLVIESIEALAATPTGYESIIGVEPFDPDK